jgi:hypothetical protein
MALRRRRNRLPFAEPKMLTRPEKKISDLTYLNMIQTSRRCFAWRAWCSVSSNSLGVVSYFLFLTLLSVGNLQPTPDTVSAEVFLKRVTLDLPSVIS